jgi:hypothetical protein
MIAARTIDARQHPVLGLFILAGIIGVIFLFVWFATRFIPRRISRWDTLVLRFPANDVHKFGGRYGGCSGFFGNHRRNNDVSSAFLIEFAQEGLAITANFAKKSPILIPWSAIREVEQIDGGFAPGAVIVNVDYETRMGFFLPKPALEDLQKNLPGTRFSEPKTLFGFIKERFQNRPK